MSKMLKFALVLLTLGVVGCAELDQEQGGAIANTGIRFLANDDGDNFARATVARDFVFPVDHGSHPNYQTEWWYFTGNVFGPDQRHYGFQMTFFRYALAAGELVRESAWATNQFWMAHFALSDTANGEFITEERLTRAALGLAGASHSPFRVWVEDWSVAGNLSEAAIALRLQAATRDMGIDLSLTGLKPPVLQGDSGLDRKGPEPGNSSYYYSLARLGVEGSIRVGDGPPDNVAGFAWMDREWGTSALSEGITGWDWFALQLSDGRDLMYYQLRHEDGSTSPFSGGTLIALDGAVHRLTATDIELEVLDQWSSAASLARYPVAWRLRIPSEQIELEVTPYLPNQEINLSVRYWEGAVQVNGRDGTQVLGGNGYLELTGY